MANRQIIAKEQHSLAANNDALRTIKTTCPYCGVGCGVVATVDSANRTALIAGDKDHPANYGRLCSKGSALGNTLSTKERAMFPLVNGKQHSWDDALDHVANQFTDIIKQHGRESIMLYVSGQLLTEDYYVANKFIKSGIGNNNIDSNSRLCMSSAVAAYKRAFASDTVPVNYSDIETSELFILIGSNMAWCHPVLFQRLKAAQQQDNKKVVVIDPRKTDSCAIADLHLAIKPGTDTILFNGLLKYLHDNNMGNPEYLQHVSGIEQALDAAASYTLNEVAQACDVPKEALQTFYSLFSETKKTVSFYSMGVNQSSSGTDKANAIINAHLFTGKIGYPGAGPFSITGQPNAMGGREVGALSNLLAAHFDLASSDDRAQVAEFWQGADIAPDKGITATQAAQAILDGDIKAIWIMATNPVVSLPDSNLMRQALTQCELVIVSDCIADTDTGRYADVHFPAQGWGEKSGTVTNSERRISRQRPLFDAFAQAKPDWWIVSQVAQRMGLSGFDFNSEYDVFKEHVALSAYKNQGQRLFNLSALSELKHNEYDELQPLQWPYLKKANETSATDTTNTANNSAEAMFSAAYYFNKQQAEIGGLDDNIKHRLLTAYMPAIHPQPVKEKLSQQFPLSMNTGRIRDQWHTMTRTGLASNLNQHFAQPFVQIHPKDAKSLQVADNDLVTVNSALDTIIVRAKIDRAMRCGEVFVPIHWSKTHANQANVGALIHEHICPHSAQPELKYTPVNVQPLVSDMHGVVLSRELIAKESLAIQYWSMSQQEHCYQYHLAFADSQPLNKERIKETVFASSMTSLSHAEQHWISYIDESTSDYRFALLDQGRLQAIAFYHQDQTLLPEMNWLRQCFNKQTLNVNEQKALLMGKPLEGDFDVGRIICSCFTVGEKTICKAIHAQGLKDAAAIGRCLKAGTNCGSCVPELNEILLQERERNNG